MFFLPAPSPPPRPRPPHTPTSAPGDDANVSRSGPGNGLSPLTREPLRPLLVHNVTLRRRIESYEEEQAALLETVAHAQRERRAEPEDGPPARRQRVS